MEFFILVVLIGLIPAVIAQGKGRSFVLWWLYGAALFIVALPHALIMPSRKVDPNAPTPETHVRCPDCKELVLKEAKVCKYCGCKLVPQT